MLSAPQQIRFATVLYKTWEGLVKRARSLKSGVRSTEMQKSFAKQWQLHKQGFCVKEKDHPLNSSQLK
eukprot:5777506-Amphidinium_carterae.1